MSVDSQPARHALAKVRNLTYRYSPHYIWIPFASIGVLAVSLRQLRVNCFEACGIVGYRLTFLWRMASENQNDRHTSGVVRDRAATV